MEDWSFVKEVARATPYGSRPRVRWEDMVKADLQLLGVADPGQCLVDVGAGSTGVAKGSSGSVGFARSIAW